MLDKRFEQVFATHRSNNKGKEELLGLESEMGGKLVTLKCDARVEEEVEEMLKEVRNSTPSLNLVVNCVGILHDNPSKVEEGKMFSGPLQPEKSVTQLSRLSLLHYFDVNTVPTALLANYLQVLGLFKHPDPSVFATISGKVGSIGDNKLGGWHGYRASKAAQHMIMKGTSLEYNKTNPNTVCVSLHPGTVQTNLSAPFRDPHKFALLSPEESASSLLEVIEKLEKKNSGEVWGWDGEQIEY